MISLLYLLYTEDWGFEPQAHISAQYAGQAREDLQKLGAYRDKEIHILKLVRKASGDFSITDTDGPTEGINRSQ